MVVNTLPKSVISGLRKVHLLLLPPSNSQSSIIVCANVVRGYSLSKLCGNVNVSSPVKFFPCKHFSHQTYLSSWISVKSGICSQIIRSCQKFSLQRYSQLVDYCKNARKQVFSRIFFALRPKDWLCGKVRLERIVFGSALLVPSFAFSKGEGDIVITDKESEKKKKERGRLFMLLFNLYEVVRLCLRTLRLILTFGPILVLYPVTYLGQTATDVWWSLLLRGKIYFIVICI